MWKQIQCKETEVGYKMHVLTGVVSLACNHRQVSPLARQLILHSPFLNLKYHFLDWIPGLGILICWTITVSQTHVFLWRRWDLQGSWKGIFSRRLLNVVLTKDQTEKKINIFIHASKIPSSLSLYTSFHFFLYSWIYNSVRGTTNLWANRIDM